MSERSLTRYKEMNMGDDVFFYLYVMMGGFSYKPGAHLLPYVERNPR